MMKGNSIRERDINDFSIDELYEIRDRQVKDVLKVTIDYINKKEDLYSLEGDSYRHKQELLKESVRLYGGRRGARLEPSTKAMKILDVYKERVIEWIKVDGYLDGNGFIRPEGRAELEREKEKRRRKSVQNNTGKLGKKKSKKGRKK